MTDTHSTGERSSEVGLAQLPFSKPVLQTYSRRNRSCIPGSVLSAQEAGSLTASAPKSDRQAKLDVTKNPFFKRYSLQHSKTAPQQPNKRSFTQLHLDIGQANFACITCSVCGLIYAKGEANDEKVHALFHANCTQGVKFQGWQHERVVKWDGREGRVLLVIPDDPATHLKKVKEICGVVEDHLGLCKGWLLSAPYQVYLYISSSKYVLGCVVSERITSASPVISHSEACASDLVECKPSWSEGGVPQVHHDIVAGNTDYSAADGSVNADAVATLDALDTASQSLSRPHTEVQTEILMTDRSKAVKAVCGIKVVWVSAQARRQGIATQLLDTARCNCVAGYVVPRSQLAFSQPTQAGRRLAEQYTQTHSFLVYQ
ncbi:hypothetical protein WJX79_007986 [Trebouxia sp. C0005]